jgi:hypothetical protein
VSEEAKQRKEKKNPTSLTCLKTFAFIFLCLNPSIFIYKISKLPPLVIRREFNIFPPLSIGRELPPLGRRDRFAEIKQRQK